MNSFKVVLYLNQFFTDHRSVSRIFVNPGKIETIKDLQDHIGTVFNIKNFYLMVHNEFLPSTESVKILNPDDKVSAIPLQTKGNKEISIENTDCNHRKPAETVKHMSSDEEIAVTKKRKKKNKNKLHNNKKKKHLPTSTPINGDTEAINEDGTKPYSSLNETINSSRNRVKDKVEYFEKQIDHPYSMSLPNIAQKDQSAELINSLEKVEEEREIASIADLMRKHKLYVKPNESNKNISLELPQERNIVKNIVITKETTTSGFNSAENSNPSDPTTNCKDQKVENKINILQHIVLNTENTADYDEQNMDITEPLQNVSKPALCITSSEQIETQHLETFVTKRKRVRTRKRKSKDVQTGPKIVVPNYDFNMKLPKASPAIHIKFDEEDNEEEATTAEIEAEPQQLPQEINTANQQDATNQEGDIIEIEDKKEVHASEKNITKETVVDPNNFVECVLEKINDYPLITNSTPEIGNVIAFKILKLADHSFTPELSSYIVGKVAAISADEESLTINILDGLQEFKKPVGIFSLTFEEDEECDVEATQDFERRQLIELRLISM